MPPPLILLEQLSRLIHYKRTQKEKNKHTRKKSGWNQNDKSRKCWETGDVKKSVSFRYFLWLGHAFVIISLWQILNFYP